MTHLFAPQAAQAEIIVDSFAGGGGARDPWRTAAEIIDWSRPCHSIFLTPDAARAVGVKRPLAEATLRRVARGVVRYVLDHPRPFVIPVTHGGDARCWDSAEPLRTITTARRGEMMVAVPSLVQTGYGERSGQAPRVPGLGKPLGTAVAGGTKHALVAAFLARHYTDQGQRPGTPLDEPISTVTAVDHHSVIAAHLTQFRGSNRGSAGDPRDPLATVTGQGTHAGLIAPFLARYYGEGGQWAAVDEPLCTVTTRDRMALVTVHLDGVPYVIADIGIRMLSPRELFRAQGFPDSYVIDLEIGGRAVSKAQQVRCAGNSVCPPLAAALARANVPELAAGAERREAAAS
ncbi:DNA cytosine methyltransferase [Roseospira goensis]|uniref:Site-specific DNA-cytosine methylase n=1 Tax=Roseospira goensis TaxID=391922 RepID=A0A7W6RZP2_9PROT|nr:DNA cytosine methyltransferase [Roseospira goensis]MBB4286205.1 site-specific DNA-cytosine methylase [Roseospira goensis]